MQISKSYNFNDLSLKPKNTDQHEENKNLASRNQSMDSDPAKLKGMQEPSSRNKK